MATTATTIPNQPVTYALLVIFTVATCDSPEPNPT